MGKIMSWGNPYTHEEHKRECIPNSFHHYTRDYWHMPVTSDNAPIVECDWCGSKPRRLFRYDGDKHLFCNRDCYNSYHC